MKQLRSTAAVAATILMGWTVSVHGDVVTEWNTLAMQCLDRPGPGALLDLAVVHAAMHDAIQAIEGTYERYVAATPPATGDESPAAAAAAAARRVLSTFCPATAQAALDAAFAPFVAGNDPGLAIGYAAGDALLAERRPAPPTPPFVGGTGAGEWRPTPPANAPMAFLYLATTEPFVMTSPSQFRPEPPPALASRTYLHEYNEVKERGAVESHPATAACPAPDDTDMARFWTANVVLLWNQAARDIALDRQLSLGDAARLLALANLAAADAVIAGWDSKRHYNYWRPITAIRDGSDDGNDETVGDADWTPFIQSTHFPAGSQTPPYPEYASTANALTAAYVATLRLFFGTDWLPFQLYKATPPSVAICTNPRSYRRLSDAAAEVVDARIWLGIHFRSADREGRRLGARAASWAFYNALRPARHRR